MANLNQASIAERFLNEIPRRNNRARNEVKAILALRTEFNALAQADRDAALVVIAERGYDVAEFNAILAAWLAVDAEMTTRGIVNKDVPL